MGYIALNADLEAGTPVAPGPVVPVAPTPPTTPGAPTPPTTPGGLAALGANRARINANRVLLGLACNGNTICEGQLAILTAGAGTAAKKVVTYGSASYSIPAGGKKTIKVKLNKKGEALVRKHRKTKVAVRLTPKSGTPITAKLTLIR